MSDDGQDPWWIERAGYEEEVRIAKLNYRRLAAKLAECEAERARLVSAAADGPPRFASLAEYDAHWHPERGQ